MDLVALRAAMSAAIPKARPVLVPAWNTTVYVRPLTIAEAEDLGQSGDKKRNLARGLAAAMTDEDGRRLFDPNSDADIELISSQSFASLSALVTAANEGNASTEAEIERLGNGSTPEKS